MRDRISFFVSSTFKDMQGERDALHRIVMPRLYEFARGYGRTVEFIDLRWGISTDDLEAEEGSDKILSVCLDEIEYCAPYMIVILGERYGWMPSADIINDAARRKNFAVDGEQISVTELEIQYGIWKSDGKLDRCIFCMRDSLDESLLTEEEKGIYLPGSDTDKAHMHKLKEKIMGNPSACIINYSLAWDRDKKGVGVYDSFSEKLTSALLDILKKEWREGGPRSWIERQRAEDRLMTDALAGRFSAREDLLEDLLSRQMGSGLLLLSGKHGCGMSSLMAKLSVSLQEEGKYFRTIYCGNGFCTDTEHLLKILCEELMGADVDPEFWLEKPGSSDRFDRGKYFSWKEKWDELAADYDGEKIYFLIDGIQHLIPDSTLADSSFLPSKGCSEKIAFIISTTMEVPVDCLAVERLKRWCVFYDVTDCDPADIRAIVTARLRAEHKQIGERVMQAILTHPLCTNMICLELMIQDVLKLDQKDFSAIARLEESMPGNEAIAQYLCDVIGQHPKRENDLFYHWMIRNLHILAEHDDRELNLLYYTLCCMGLPLGGISMEELSDLSRFTRENSGMDMVYWKNWWEEVRFVKLRRYLGSMLKRTVEGRYDFFHQQMKSAIFAGREISTMIGGPMFYFASLPDTSDLKQENLLPSFLSYAVSRWEELTEEKKERYFFGPIERAFSYCRDSDPRKVQIGEQWLQRMQNGIRKNILYGQGEERLRILCRLLKEKAAAGTPVTECSIRFFTDRFSVMLSGRSAAEHSILLCYLIALVQGYKVWEEKNPPCYEQEHRRQKPELGVYETWTFVQQKGLAWVYTSACEHYHRLRALIQCSADCVFLPDWEWDKLRSEVAKYLNLINTSRDRYLYYLCAKICIWDAEKFFLINAEYSYQCLYKNANNFRKFLSERAASAPEHKHPEVFIRFYITVVTKMADAYLSLAEIALDQGRKKETLSWEAKHICEVAEKKLKKEKFITELPDLPPDLRIAYARTLYASRFFSGKAKQMETDHMWEVYQAARDTKGWLEQYATREEILKIGMTLMEYLLMGYVPEIFVKNGGTKSAYANTLIWNEGTYMMAMQQKEESPRTQYERYLLRCVFEIYFMEKNFDSAKENCQQNIESLESLISHWEKSMDFYVYKMRKLLQWNREFMASVIFES